MSKRLDPALETVLGWAKGIALAAGDDTLKTVHVLLGAIKCREQHPGLKSFFEIKGNFPSGLDPALKDAFQNVPGPVLDRKMKLSPGLDKIIDETWERHGDLVAEEVLQGVKDAVIRESPWAKDLFRNEPAEARADIGRIIDAVKKTETLEAKLVSRIVGQEMAVDQVCDAFFHACLRAEGTGPEATVGRGPSMIFTFLGPSGVGKTFMAELIAEFMAPDGRTSENLLRLDMSAYAGHQAHEQLVGFSAAYAGASKGILTAFVKDHPRGVVIGDEIEKAHRNTQNLFLQILDYGKVYENNTKEWIDCSGITVIFTTNLGSELYDTPERFGVLRNSQRVDEVILEALGKDMGRQAGADPSAGLSPEMLSRLAKGQLVLFERLDGLSLERIAQKTVDQVSSELQGMAGLRLTVSDPVLLTLLVLRFGGNGDARRLTTGLKNFLYAAIKDTLFENRQALIGEQDPLLPRASGFRITLPAAVSLPEGIRKAVGGKSRVLIIDDHAWPSAGPVETLDLARVEDAAAADELLRARKADFILLDLHIGAAADAPDMEKGLGILNLLRTRYPEVPLYLFSEKPERRKLSTETLQSVSRKGGARGVLQKRFFGDGERDATDRDAFFLQLKEVDARLRRERLLEQYRRQLKTVDLDFRLPSDAPEPDGLLRLELANIREVVAVSARDRSQLGWVDIPTERFADIAGAGHAKERLMEITRWLSNPGGLRDLGLDLPKGILLTGPPGTGKTSLARAVAGEAQVPFFAISGTDVLSKWVGESEAAIRDLFGRARRYAPSIIFIDEIDGIGGTRSAGPGNDFRVGVLNQLLAQMDGFTQGPGRPIFVLAATNRPDILDPALLRPGRFDYQIEVPQPTAEARHAIFGLYLKKLPKDQDIAIDPLVSRTTGMSGAEIRQICKEAAWLAYREGSRLVGQRHLNEAVTTVRFGLASERVVLDEGSRHATAIHEAGHAVAHLRLFPEEPVSQITILPRGKALGFMEHEPPSHYTALSAERITRDVRVLLAGRVAEEIMLGSGSVTAGCSDDLERASVLAAKMVGAWGMNDKIGLISYAGLCSGLGKAEGDLADPGLNQEVFTEAKLWIEVQRGAVKDLLLGEKDLLDRITEALVKRETLYGEDMKRLVDAPISD